MASFFAKKIKTSNRIFALFWKLEEVETYFFSIMQTKVLSIEDRKAINQESTIAESITRGISSFLSQDPRMPTSLQSARA